MNTSLPTPTCPCFTPTPGLLLMLTAHLHFVFFLWQLSDHHGGHYFDASCLALSWEQSGAGQDMAGDIKPLLWVPCASAHLGASALRWGPIFRPARRRVMACHHHLQNQPPTSTLTYDIWLNFSAEFQLRGEPSLERRLKAGTVTCCCTPALGPSPTGTLSSWVVFQGPGRQNHSGNVGRVSSWMRREGIPLFLHGWHSSLEGTSEHKWLKNLKINVLGVNTQIFWPGI